MRFTLSVSRRPGGRPEGWVLGTDARYGTVEVSVNVARPAFVERGRDQSVLAREKTATVIGKETRGSCVAERLAPALTQSKYLPDKFFAE